MYIISRQWCGTSSYYIQKHTIYDSQIKAQTCGRSIHWLLLLSFIYTLHNIILAGGQHIHVFLIHALLNGFHILQQTFWIHMWIFNSFINLKYEAMLPGKQRLYAYDIPLECPQGKYGRTADTSRQTTDAGLCVQVS